MREWENGRVRERENGGMGVGEWGLTNQAEVWVTEAVQGEVKHSVIVVKDCLVDLLQVVQL